MKNGDKIIDVSVIDYIGAMDNGVGLILNVIIFQECYEIIFWFNRDGEVNMTPEQKMLDKLKVDSIHEYSKYDDLVLIIYKNIPNVDKILDEFL